MMDRAVFRIALINARARIVHGWTQGVYRDGDCYCLLGALIASGILEGDFRFGAYVAQATGRLIAWNDAPGRTQAEVVACLENSIAALSPPSEGAAK